MLSGSMATYSMMPAGENLSFSVRIFLRFYILEYEYSLLERLREHFPKLLRAVTPLPRFELSPLCDELFLSLTHKSSIKDVI